MCHGTRKCEEDVLRRLREQCMAPFRTLVDRTNITDNSNNITANRTHAPLAKLTAFQINRLYLRALQLDLVEVQDVLRHTGFVEEPVSCLFIRNGN